MTNSTHTYRAIDIRFAAEEIIKTTMLFERPYGFSYIVSLVRGQDNFLKQESHRELETFGALEGENFGYVQDVTWYLIHTGYLHVVNKQYGTIQATLKGEEFVKSPTTMEVEKEDLRMQWFHLLLIGGLRDLRRVEAESLSKEPYEVYTNFVMMQVVRALPADEAALKRIAGMEQVDDALAGKILDQIAEITQTMARDEELYGAIGKAHSASHRKVKDMFEAGLEVDEIARRQNIKSNTLYAYLENLHLAGHIDLTPWIEANIDQKLLHRGTDYFRQAKTNRLTEAHDVLGIDYPTLRMCRLYARPAAEGTPAEA